MCVTALMGLIAAGNHILEIKRAPWCQALSFDMFVVSAVAATPGISDPAATISAQTMLFSHASLSNGILYRFMTNEICVSLPFVLELPTL